MSTPFLAARGEIILQQLESLQIRQVVNPPTVIVRTQPSVNVIIGGGRTQTPPTSEGPDFVFTQTTPAASWLIAHSLNGFPSVAIVDSVGNIIMAQVRYVDSNTVLVTFSQPVAGSAYLSS